MPENALQTNKNVEKTKNKTKQKTKKQRSFFTMAQRGHVTFFFFLFLYFFVVVINRAMKSNYCVINEKLSRDK